MIKFKQLVHGKDIVYVPIYSMFSHQTGKVNLTCDGNVNRWMTNFYKVKNDIMSLTIFGPSKDICENYQQFTKNYNVVFNHLQYVESKLIQKSAGIQRSDLFGNSFLFQNAKYFFDDFSFNNETLVIVESQGLLRSLLATRSALDSCGLKESLFPKLAFWCPVCPTNNKTRSFFKPEDKEENEKLFREVDNVIVASRDQVKYLDECKVKKSKVVLSEEFIDRSLPMFCNYQKVTSIVDSIREIQDKVVYLPFRLSDEGYRIWEIIEVLSDFKDARIICPNVNGASDDELVNFCMTRSHLSEKTIRDFLRRVTTIDSSREAYYTIIDNCKNVIIPYFEDIDFVMHAAVDELLRGQKKPICKVVQTKDELIQELRI